MCTRCKCPTVTGRDVAHRLNAIMQRAEASAAALVDKSGRYPYQVGALLGLLRGYAIELAECCRCDQERGAA